MKMNALFPNCLVCNRTDQEIPLIKLQFQGNAYWICPQHFPIMIHKPEQLVGKLPGAEHLAAHNHDED